MSLLNRRGFMKTFVATAAVAPSLVVRRSDVFGLLPREQGRLAAVTSLEHGDQQLRVSGSGVTFHFQNFLRVANDWRPAMLPGTPLVTGPSFPLVASRVSQSGRTIIAEGSATATDGEKKAFSYHWKAEISAHTTEANLAWFRFAITLSLPHPIQLRQESQVEPQIIVWLNSNSTLMGGQSGSWRRVLLQQPTPQFPGCLGQRPARPVSPRSERWR
jgi:hypothetical protein